MHVELLEAERQVCGAVRAFAAARVAPVAGEIDRRGSVPPDLLGELAQLGVLGCVVPESHGGSGLGHVGAALAIEELGAASGALAAVVAAHAAAAAAVAGAATPAARDRHLPAMAGGDRRGCVILPDAGIVARADGRDVVLRGRAPLVVGGAAAGVAVVAARGEAGLATFAVETGASGVAARPVATLGLAGAGAAEVTLADVRVPPEGTLGDAAVVADLVDVARIGLAAAAVGVARAALRDAVAYAGERRAFGRPLAEFQGTQWKLADMATAVAAARLLVLRAASQKDRGLSYSGEAAMAKAAAAEAAMTLATQAVQLHGGYGYTREFAVERYFRDARVLGIVGGTREAERLAVADALLAGVGGP